MFSRKVFYSLTRNRQCQEEKKTLLFPLADICYLSVMPLLVSLIMTAAFAHPLFHRLNLLLAPACGMVAESLLLLLLFLRLSLSHLFLMMLDLRPLFILFLPLLSEFMPLLLRPGSIVLYTPVPLSFPMPIILPALPVLSQPPVRNPFIVPPVSIPVMVSVVSSPAWIYIKIESRDNVIICPSPVIVTGTIPPAFP